MSFDFLFGNSVIRKVERKRKLEGEIEVLKKQQKVEIEKISKLIDEKKANLADSIDAQVAALNAQINNLKKQKVTQKD